MSHIYCVKVYLDDNVPEYMLGLLRIGSVVSYDASDIKLADYPQFVDNREYHSTNEIIDAIASALEVSKDIIQII